MSEGNSPALAGPVIADLIVKDLDNARAVTASLQSRGLAVISTSGTLVTLLFGFSALVTKAQNLPPGAKPPLYIAAGLFVLAAIAGIITNAPRRTAAATVESLAPLIEDEWWSKPAIDAQQEVARTQLDVVRDVRHVNAIMAGILIAGIAIEIVAIGAVTWAVITLIAPA